MALAPQTLGAKAIDGSKTALDGGVTALRGAKAGSAVLCDIIVPCTMENFWPNALPSGAIAPLFNTGGLLNTLTVYGVVASRRLHSWLVRCGKDILRQGGYKAATAAATAAAATR